MTKTNHLLCRGDACPMRFTCQRFAAWLNSEDDEAPEMDPDYKEGECAFYDRKEHYYGG